MRRHWSGRLLRAFVALWFVLSVGEPSVVHFCPMHGGLLGELRGADAMPDMAGKAMPAGAMHLPAAGHQAPARGSTDGSGGSKSAHAHCTCIDTCVGAGAAAPLPSPHVALEPAVLSPAAAPFVASAATLPRPAPPHVQPPGTGPPRA